MTAAEVDVLIYLKRHPNATQIETANATGRSRRAVQDAVSSLKKRGSVERIGSRKTGRWVVKE
jgi:ATP-dependent DNA helicase RecG